MLFKEKLNIIYSPLEARDVAGLLEKHQVLIRKQKPERELGLGLSFYCSFCGKGKIGQDRQFMLACLNNFSRL